MKKKYRVCKNHEFSKIIAHRTFIKSNSFIMYFIARSQDHNRVGISVGKKLGNAVVRNKIKRQVRVMVDEAFQFNEEFDAIIIVRPDYLKHDFAENLAELKQSKKRAQVRLRRDAKNASF